LEKILQALRPHTENKLYVVFGCGGDRDREKRPLMGKVAAEYADKVIVTDDNPRSENPDAIRAAIMAACPTATQIGNRVEAIAYAIGQLQKGDVLVIAGKGHESEQIIGTTTIHHHDGEVVQSILKSRAA
jgi:UDP-N-acetylmuramoyl-L-alanyl-D-glutamate--2,6-diaminopimelate ligase